MEKSNGIKQYRIIGVTPIFTEDIYDEKAGTVIISISKRYDFYDFFIEQRIEEELRRQKERTRK